LLLAGVVSVVLSTLLTIPISGIVMLVRSGAAANPADFIQSAQADPEAFEEMLTSSQGEGFGWFIRTLIDMFFSAALLEEGLKFVTCRMACKRQGMIAHGF
jgi:hypothetical protein